jgi:hypothetical protein
MTLNATPIAPAQKVGRQRLQDLLASLRLCEETGAVPELRNILKRCAPLFAESGEDDLLAEFESIETRAAEAIAFEERHGVRTLYRREHPFNVNLDRDGIVDQSSLPPPSELLEPFWLGYFERAC